MAKRVAESTNRLSVFWLKKNGYLEKGFGYRSGGIKWTYSLSGRENSINFSVIGESWDAAGGTASIELRYTNTDNYSGEKTDMNYRLELVTTQCNYGGVRYWFICPLYKNGQYCGRRVGVIYGAGKYFGCRYCSNIAYQAQFEGGRFRISITEPDVEKAFNEVKREYYGGKPTRRYKRYLRLREKMDNAWAMAAIRFGMKF